MISAADPREEFGPFDGRVWLNVAHQGPLPRRARRVVVAARTWGPDTRRGASDATARDRAAGGGILGPNEAVLLKLGVFVHR